MIDIIGIAGSGKTTQGRLLAKYLGVPWISTGHLLRRQADAKTHKDMLQGKIISDEITLNLLERELIANHAGKNEIVLDGSPRSLNQAKWLAGLVKKGLLRSRGFILLEMDPKTARRRLIARGRTDDNEEAIAERFNEYQNTILPIVNYLQSQGLKIYRVDGNGPMEEVTQRIHRVLGI